MTVMVVGMIAALPPDLPHRMSELGKDEPLHRQAYRSWRAWHEENEHIVHHARVGPGQHRGGADLLERQQAEQLAETVEAPLEQRTDRLGRAVARSKARPARHKYGVDPSGLHETSHVITQSSWILA
jgi:hypothetical protein